jgi:hypothetical protein
MKDLGPKLWSMLHRGSAQFPFTFNHSIPCGDCRRRWQKIVAVNPPVYGDGWFAWTVMVHNLVNAEIGKPQMSLADAAALWGRPTA